MAIASYIANYYTELTACNCIESEIVCEGHTYTAIYNVATEITTAFVKFINEIK